MSSAARAGPLEADQLRAQDRARKSQRNGGLKHEAAPAKLVRAVVLSGEWAARTRAGRRRQVFMTWWDETNWQTRQSSSSQRVGHVEKRLGDRAA